MARVASKVAVGVGVNLLESYSQVLLAVRFAYEADVVVSLPPISTGVSVAVIFVVSVCITMKRAANSVCPNEFADFHLTV